MKADFDIAATSYDETFTQSDIGIGQRQRVWQYLERLNGRIPLRILELNCGTGEDALFLAQNGHQVIATDISNDMITVSQAKAQDQDTADKLKFQQIDIRTIDANSFDQKFDLIFSNFGGLNCLSPLELSNLFTTASSLLSKKGRLIIVVMPRFCLIESLYLFAKFRFKDLFRRNTSSGLLVNVDGVDVNTFYYNPSHLLKLLNKSWTNRNIHSIGFIPSYLEHQMQTNKFVRNLILSIDKLLYKLNWSLVADHYLLDVSLNKSVLS